MVQAGPGFGGSDMLTYEIKNTQPIDLVDLTTSMMAFAEHFRSFTSASQAGEAPPEMKLYVDQIRTGSVVAQLIPYAQQVDWLLDHADVLAGFIGNLQELAAFFLGDSKTKVEPTRDEAKRISQILEPVAKDGGAQFNIQASDTAQVHFHAHFHIGSRDANAIQNGVRRFLGPDLPASEIRQNQLMVLDQVKNVASSKTGDRAIIEAIWPRAVKLQFLSETAKAQVLTLESNPFQKVFIVDLEVHSIGGRPALYRVIEVKDTIDKP